MTAKTFTAAILVIGNEILSGNTQDANIAYIAKHMAKRGVRIGEVRIVADLEGEIVEAVNALRRKYDYVFTTGGIGPTHDDITSESVAKALGLNFGINAEAKAKLEEYYQPAGTQLNEARLRMTMTPEGARLIDNPVSGAPGFNIENVFVLAGVPKIMQAMLLHADTMIEGGAPVITRMISCNQKEGDISAALAAIQHEFPDVDIGSYPHMYQKPSLSFALRGTDPARIEAAAKLVSDMIRARGDTPLEPKEEKETAA